MHTVNQERAVVSDGSVDLPIRVDRVEEVAWLEKELLNDFGERRRRNLRGISLQGVGGLDNFVLCDLYLRGRGGEAPAEQPSIRRLENHSKI
jgi:hypothetical protein